MIEWLIWGLIAWAVVEAIDWGSVREWFDERINRRAKFGTLVRRRVADGKYRVVAGIYGDSGTLLDQESWVGRMDKDLEREFSGKTSIRIEL